jgi:hypothetical protein
MLSTQNELPLQVRGIISNHHADRVSVDGGSVHDKCLRVVTAP